MAHPRITVIPGDGIGPDIVDATLQVLAHLQVRTRIRLRAGGPRCARTRRRSDSAGDARSDRAQSRDAERSDHDADRPRLLVDQRVATAIVRSVCQRAPVLSMPGVRSRYADIDIIIVRENMEGLYSGVGQTLQRRRRTRRSPQRRHATRLDAPFALRVRDGAPLRPQESDCRAQGQHSENHFGPVSRRCARGVERLCRSQVRRDDHRQLRDAARAESESIRRDRHDQPIRRHPLRFVRRTGGRLGPDARAPTSANTKASSKRCTAARRTSPARTSPIRPRSSSRRR